jgi:nucleoside-diphosphate-sugar epimerase/carbamoylphosphate synthase large subunit
MKKIIIGITSIGSGVGQSIINSIRLSNLPVYTIGMGNNPMAFGAYDCSESIITPSIYEEKYIDKIIEICQTKKINILIPGLDDELLKFSENINLFKKNSIEVVVSSPEIIELCRNKIKMSNELNKISNSFVKSYSLNEFRKTRVGSEIYIAKPISGFASRGIKYIYTQDDLDKLNEKYLIQEIAIPNKNDVNHIQYMNDLKANKFSQLSEISIQYLIGKNKNLLGKCATYNKLNNGVPIEIIPFENEKLFKVTDKIIKYLIELGLYGPINIQGRITDKGPKFFEMNARFTGITGLRALMGFNEVEKIIKNILYQDNKAIHLTNKKVGIRQVSDRIVNIDQNKNLKKHVEKSINKKIQPEKKNILLTGGTGFLGTALLKKLIIDDNIKNIYCIYRDEKNIKITNNKIKYLKIEDLENEKNIIKNIYCLIHLAFGRTINGVENIAKSLEFTNKIFNIALKNHFLKIINISTQAIYGTKKELFWTENTLSSPETPYAMAKYSSELLLQNLSLMNPKISITSLRVAALVGEDIGKDALIYKFINTIFNNQNLTINGGTQSFDYIDVEDVSKAILKLIYYDNLKKIYNIGSGKSINILDLSEIILNKVKKYKQTNTKIILKKDDTIKMNFGMNIDKIKKDILWYPKVRIEDTVENILKKQFL